MYKVDIPLDTKEAEVIARRKSAEDARKKRIFNPRHRMFARDLEALKIQIEEKRNREQEERERTDVFAEDVKRRNEIACDFQRRIKNDRMLWAKDIDLYRKMEQRYEDRREFDLNDRNRMKKVLPNRLYDEDTRCGAASLQRFDGEDSSTKERICAQTLQRRLWLDAQVNEKKLNEIDNRKAKEVYEQRLREMDLRSSALCHAEIEARKAVRNENYQYNLALSVKNDKKRLQEKRAEEEATMAHIVNMCNSELLTETQDSYSVGGPHRVCRERYKGFSKDRLAMIREDQLQQIMQKADRAEVERQRNEAWGLMKRREELAGLMNDLDISKHRRNARIETERTNQELAREQSLRQEYLNRILYRDTPTADFYEQFGTTTR